MADQRPSTTPLPFLRLPPELRNAIYALVIPTTARLCPPCTPGDQSQSLWALAHVSKLVRAEFTTLFYSTAQLVIPLPTTSMSNPTSAYHNWLANTDDRLLGSANHIVLETEILVRQIVQWRVLPQEINIGLFRMKRKFQRVRIMLDRAHACAGWEVSCRILSQRKLRAVSTRTTRFDKRWVSEQFSWTNGPLWDGDWYRCVVDVEDMVAAVKEVLKLEKAGALAVTPGKEDLRRVVAMVWRWREWGGAWEEDSVGSDGGERLQNVLEYGRREFC
ncbi:MAG: hypothetical protein Q9208_004649 [Pyrenodesmia sp. 3 TL-2023]